MADREKTFPITVTAQPETPTRRLAADLDSLRRKVYGQGVLGILRVDAACRGMRPIAGIVAPQRCRNRTLRSRGKARQTAGRGCSLGTCRRFAENMTGPPGRHGVSPLRARAGQESNKDENCNGIANTHVAGHEVSFKRLAGYAAPRLVKTIGEKTTDNCWFFLQTLQLSLLRPSSSAGLWQVAEAPSSTTQGRFRKASIWISQTAGKRRQGKTRIC